jgi:hypothetical protein
LRYARLDDNRGCPSEPGASQSSGKPSWTSIRLREVTRGHLEGQRALGRDYLEVLGSDKGGDGSPMTRHDWLTVLDVAIVFREPRGRLGAASRRRQRHENFILTNPMHNLLAALGGVQVALGLVAWGSFRFIRRHRTRVQIQ